MGTSSILDILETKGTDVSEGSAAERKHTIVEQLKDAGRRTYTDVNGDGSRYVLSGSRHGVAFATAYLDVDEEGMCQVTVTTGQRLSTPELERFAKKIFRGANNTFMVEGLAVENGEVVFKTEKFDVLTCKHTADKVAGLALSTVHGYAYVWAGLEAGVDPWDLTENEHKRPSRPNDDDGGTSVDNDGDEPWLTEIHERLQRLLQSL